MWETQMRPSEGLQIDFGTRDGAAGDYDVITAYNEYLKVGIIYVLAAIY